MGNKSSGKYMYARYPNIPRLKFAKLLPKPPILKKLFDNATPLNATSGEV